MAISEIDIKSVKTFIKARLQKDCVNFHGNSENWQNVRNILYRTAEGESNSLLVTGPRGCGKTTFINSVLNSLMEETFFKKNTIIVYLNGLIETDDRLSLKSITTQLNLEKVSDGKIFRSFAENLSFLLSCLCNSESKKAKSIIFILEEFDLFCHHHGQTLLYNLFDISQSAHSPICVLGITCRLDVIELLEKRVKSRFSHRQIYLFNSTPEITSSKKLIKDFLIIPSKVYFTKKDKTNHQLKNYYLQCRINSKNFNFNKSFTEKWNNSIANLLENTKVRECIEGLIEIDLSEDYLKKFLFRLVSMVNLKHPFVLPEDLLSLYADYDQDEKITILIGLSVLEICLIISIKHHCEIYDYDPFNFEIIYTRFLKYSLKSTVMQFVERTVALKAFEHIKSLELILPVSSTASSKIKKEYQMYKLALTLGQINRAVNSYIALPTEVSQWAKSSFV